MWNTGARVLVRSFRGIPHILRRGLKYGFCPVCQGRTIFFKEGDWLRDQFLCIRCRSIPRYRALMDVLETHFPNWRDLDIHESSPGGPASDKLAREGKRYVPTHCYPDVAAGQAKNGYRCEDLECLTFADESFDLTITEDVFEHVLDPARAFREIARTLRPGGAHVFTVPWYYWKPTRVRAFREIDGTIRHLTDPDYHGNPIDADGSLVITEWGYDLADFIYVHSGLTTTAIRIRDRQKGIEAEFIEVFISRKRL